MKVNETLSVRRGGEALTPAASDAEFDPRAQSGKTVSQAIDLTDRGGAPSEPGETDPWTRYIAEIETQEAETSEPVVPEPEWPTVGIETPVAPSAAAKQKYDELLAQADFSATRESTPAVVTPDSAEAATNAAHDQVDEPAGTPGLTVMRDVMSSEAATSAATSTPMTSAPSRPAPSREQARSSAPSPRAAARRTHRSGGSKRGGGGSGVSSLLDKFRSGWGIAAGVVFLLIFGFILLTGGGSSTPSTEAVVAQDPGLSGSSTVNVMSAHAFQGAAVPVSSAAGPRSIDDVRASGFAHTELGAAMAALHLAVRTDPATSPAVFVPTIQEQTTGDTAGFLATRQKQYAALAKAAKVPAGQPIIAPTGSMVGWKIPTGWSADAPTTVHLLVQIPNSGKWVDIAPTVVWDAAANDYKLQVSADGTLPSTTATPDGYTKFLQ